MSPLIRSPDLEEYIWPCGYHENVKIEQAPAIPFVAVEFPLPLAKPVKQFTEFEKGGIPALRKCCKCGEKYHLFRIPDGCKMCSHSFRDPCSTCTIVGFSGSREIATVELKVTGEFDQTPEYWRCRLCEDINPFESSQIANNGFMVPYKEPEKNIHCNRCSEPFHKTNWVISPFHVYLGSWDGKIVAESGPWHWSLAWHQDMSVKQAINHREEDCYMRGNNGRRRRAIPWIGKPEDVKLPNNKPAAKIGKAVQKEPAKAKVHTVPLPTPPPSVPLPPLPSVPLPAPPPSTPLPTPPPSRSPSTSPHSRSRSKSQPRQAIIQPQTASPATDMHPPPLFSSPPVRKLSTSKSSRLKSPPISSTLKSPPPPMPQMDWKTRPLPPVPVIPTDITSPQRGRPVTRREYNTQTVREEGPGRMLRQKAGSPQERSRSREIPETTGLPEDSRHMYPAKSHIFQQNSQTYVPPSPQPSPIPTPQPSPVPKIEIQPDSPAVERLKLNRGNSNSSFSTDSDTASLSYYLVNNNNTQSSKPNTPPTLSGRSSLESPYSNSRNKNENRTSSHSTTSNHGTQTPPTMEGYGAAPSPKSIPAHAPAASSSRSRSTPPRYFLFPSVSRPATPDSNSLGHRQKMGTTLGHKKSSSSDTVIPRHHRLGHSRSRSEGGPSLTPSTNPTKTLDPRNNTRVVSTASNTSADVLMVLMLPGTSTTTTHRRSSEGNLRHHHQQHQHAGRNTTPDDDDDGYDSEGSVVEQQRPEVYYLGGDAVRKVRVHTAGGSALPVSGWYASEEDLSRGGRGEYGDGEGEGEGGEGGEGRRSGSRRRTFAKALKVKNWF